VALDETLVPSAQRLRIGRSNFRLPSDIQSKEPTIEVVYDVLRNSPFFKAFLVTADVPEIYMQEFWATAKLHQHSIRFKMDTRKYVLDLEAFREMLHISPRIPGQSFAELSFEEEILEFLRFLGHSTQIKTLTDPSIPRRNRVNWHYVRDDVLFSTIKVGSRHQTTQQYDAILPIKLTTKDIRNSKAYKEYYACATGEAAPKPKASAKKKKGGSASSITPPTPITTLTPTTTVVAAPRLSAAAIGKQPARATTPTEPTDVERTEAEQLKIVLKRSRQETYISQQSGSGTDEGTGSRPRVPDVPSNDSEEELLWNSSDDEDVDEQTKGREESEGDKTDESDNDDDDQDEAEKVNDDDDDEEEITKIDDDNNEEDQGLRIGDEEMMHEEEDVEELYRLESLFTTGLTTVTPIPSPQSTMTPSIISTFTTPRRPPTPDRDWKKYVPAAQGNPQSWISALAKQTNARSSLNELFDTPIDFSNFIMNRLGVDTLTLNFWLVLPMN
nr:hypothetical protein [Tanacetum cinerariifolium]